MNPKKIALSSIFLALTLLMGISRIGYVAVPTPAGAATLMHIPVILAGILLGPWVGALAGLMFGFSAVLYFSHIAPFWVLLPARPFIGIVSGLVYAFFLRYTNYQKKIRNYALVIIAIAIFSFLYLSGLFILNEWFSDLLVTYPIEYSFLVSIVAFVISISIIFLIKEKEIKIIGLGIASFLGSLTNTIGTLGLAAMAKIFPIQVIITIGIVQGIPEAVLATIICPPIVLAIEKFVKRE
uniref:ECF transporter S component n=1 Tax=Dictyoglomus thermophilum TaxID=14 RepID=A0A7V3ZHV2_DICTH